MRLSNGSSKHARVSQKLPNTWDTIHRIGQTLGLSVDILRDMLQITAKEMEKAHLARKDLEAEKIFALAERLNIGFNCIVTGKIDYQALTQHYQGNNEFLPDRYHQMAFSRRRNTLHALNYVEEVYGWQERLLILRNFQMNEAVFANPDAPISLHFNMDLFEYLNRFKFGDEDMTRLTVHSFMSLDWTAVQNELADCSYAWEIYDRMCGSLLEKYVEKNYDYRILKMDETSCTVEAKPKDSLCDLLGSKTVGNHAVDLVRCGNGSAFPLLLGLPAATSKLHAGVGGKVKYEFDFTDAHSVMQLKKIRSFPRSLAVH